MRRIDGDRRHHRQNLFQKALVQPRLFRRGQIAAIGHQNAVGRQLALELVPAPVLFRHQLGGEASHLVQLLGGGQAVIADFAQSLAHLADQARHPHHVEFVEIVAGDRQEAQPLEQGMRQVPRLFQHPHVEAQPRALAVDVA